MIAQPINPSFPLQIPLELGAKPSLHGLGSFNPPVSWFEHIPNLFSETPTH